MKSERGITLISLIVYVIVMLIVVTIIGTITTYFYSNINDEYVDIQDEFRDSNLDMYLLDDLKNQKVDITDVNGNKLPDGYRELKSIRLIYKDFTSVTYVISEDGIYRNNEKIYNINENQDMYFILENIIVNQTEIATETTQKLSLKILENNSLKDTKSYVVNNTKLIYNQ